MEVGTYLKMKFLEGMDNKFSKLIYILLQQPSKSKFHYQSAQLNVGFSYFNWTQFVNLKKFVHPTNGTIFNNDKKALQYVIDEFKIEIIKQSVYRGDIIIHILDAYVIFDVLAFVCDDKRLEQQYKSYMDKLSYAITSNNIKSHKD